MRLGQPGKSSPARMELAANNRGLVFACVLKLRTNLPRDELVSCGDAALVEAAVWFRPRRAKFSTYATWAINCALWDMIRRDRLPKASSADFDSHAWRTDTNHSVLPTIPEFTEALAALPRRYRKVLKVRFGWGRTIFGRAESIGRRPVSYLEVAEQMGLSRDGTKQLVADALERLRRNLQENL